MSKEKHKQQTLSTCLAVIRKVHFIVHYYKVMDITKYNYKLTLQTSRQTSRKSSIKKYRGNNDKKKNNKKNTPT
jgi:hypothetical protein